MNHSEMLKPLTLARCGMGTLHDQFFEAMEIALNGRTLDEEAESRLAKLAVDAVPEIAAGLLKSLRHQAPAMLQDEATIEARFVARNSKRWKRPLDEVRMMLRIAEEAGMEAVAGWNSEDQESPCKFAALNHLHVKALLAAREIICLIEGGYADGALARWRTLHELAVLAMFIVQSDEFTARRFVASFDFKAHKAALQLNQFAERANLGRFTDEEIRQLSQLCDRHTAELGPGLGEEYGWTKPAFVAKRLEDLEKATGLDHWRPRYRWASQNVHGGFRPPGASLGVSEAVHPVHLIGRSNSGMVDPLHMCALSLSIVSVAFLTNFANLDRLVFAKVLELAAVDVGNIALRAERTSARRAAANRARNRKKAPAGS